MQNFRGSITDSADKRLPGSPPQPLHPAATAPGSKVPAPEKSAQPSAGGLSPATRQAPPNATGERPNPAKQPRITPHARWIYQLPRTWTRQDYDQTKLSSDLAYSHMAMMTQLPNGSLASLMQVRASRM